MDKSPDIRILKCLDGLGYSFAVLDSICSSLHEVCARINEDSSALVPALWQCWSFVDVVHRIREIAQALPGLSHRNVELKTFLSATELAKESRNYIQHLRKELLKKDMSKYPVWGSLAWVDPTDPTVSYIVFVGAQLTETTYTSCVFDTLEKRWVSKVCLGVAGNSLNFDPMYRACVRFRDFILPWTMSMYEPGIRITDKPQIVTIRLSLTQRENT